MKTIIAVAKQEHETITEGRTYFDKENLYVAIPWPENQEYMEEEWFQDEAILDVDSKIGDSTYLIPIKRL